MGYKARVARYLCQFVCHWADAREVRLIRKTSVRLSLKSLQSERRSQDQTPESTGHPPSVDCQPPQMVRVLAARSATSRTFSLFQPHGRAGILALDWRRLVNLDRASFKASKATFWPK
ncbi:Hypothetical protein NTJ_07642 [Nesidiocoris tenuis]|uniref:Uncharacterized protein n=1 Tax=Nesidiocoris tenuis TaxID=355587 RepID=A0ABN7ARZ5_9HEMI|nr:Hypothetical protein NTJ_07642 [Nesidiocoris tenuis]